MSTRYRADIDGLRALSIVLVVLFHAGVAGVGGGYVGVDVFFVLSGYLITGLLLAEHQAHGRISLSRFVARRVRRLLPMACLVVVTTVVAGLWLLPPLRRGDLVRDARAATLYVANLRFADQAVAYSDTEVTDGLLTHYWSLSIEEQFYVLWPLTVIGIGVVVGRRWPHRYRAVLGAAAGSIVAGSLVQSALLTTRHGPSSYYLTSTRLWEIGVGAVTAITLPRLLPGLRRLPAPVIDGAGLSGLLAIVGAAVAFGSETKFPGTAALVPVLGTAAIVATGAVRSTTLARALSWRPLPRVGRWSYAWYLWHWPAIGVGLLLNKRAGAPWSVGTITAAAVAVSLGLAVVSHVFVENPIRTSRALQALPRRSLALGGALMAATLFAGAVGLRLAGDGGVVLAGSGSDAMSPVQASNDKVSVGRAADCNAQYTDVEARGDCVFGDPDGELTIGLVGDSHAQQWLPALDAAGRDRGWRVVAWTKSACTFLDVPLYNSRFQRPYDECDRWRDDVAERLEGEAPVDALVVTSSQALRKSVIGADGDVLADAETISEVWHRGASATLPSLFELTPTIVRLYDTPWARWDIPTCLSEHASDPTWCEFPLVDTQYHLDSDLLDAEQRAAAEADSEDQVHFVDMSDVVCPHDPCEVVRPDGTIIFRDQHHLTQTFSLQLASELGDRISAVLPVKDGE